jgi:hypothetical protein
VHTNNITQALKRWRSDPRYASRGTTQPTGKPYMRFLRAARPRACRTRPCATLGHAVDRQLVAGARLGDLPRIAKAVCGADR